MQLDPRPFDRLDRTRPGGDRQPLEPVGRHPAARDAARWAAVEHVEPTDDLVATGRSRSRIAKPSTPEIRRTRASTWSVPRWRRNKLPAFGHVRGLASGAT